MAQSRSQLRRRIWHHPGRDRDRGAGSCCLALLLPSRLSSWRFSRPLGNRAVLPNASVSHWATAPCYRTLQLPTRQPRRATERFGFPLGSRAVLPSAARQGPGSCPMPLQRTRHRWAPSVPVASRFAMDCPQTGRLTLLPRVGGVLDHELALSRPPQVSRRRWPATWSGMPAGRCSTIPERLVGGAEGDGVEARAVAAFQHAAHVDLADDLGELDAVRREGEARLRIALAVRARRAR